MSEFIGTVGQDITHVLTLKKRQHVGHSRPVWLHTLVDCRGNEVSIFTTKQEMLATSENTTMLLFGNVRDHKVVNGRNVTIINDFEIISKAWTEDI